jgi:hypothetical protein
LLASHIERPNEALFGCRDRLITRFLEQKLTLEANELSQVPKISATFHSR